MTDFTKISDETVAVANSSKELTSTEFTDRSDGASIRFARIQVEDNSVRVRDSDNDPVAGTSPGEIWYVGEIKEVWGFETLTKIRFINRFARMIKYMIFNEKTRRGSKLAFLIFPITDR